MRNAPKSSNSSTSTDNTLPPWLKRIRTHHERLNIADPSPIIVTILLICFSLTKIETELPFCLGNFRRNIDLTQADQIGEHSFAVEMVTLWPFA